MSRTLTIDPVTRIEGHAQVHIDIGDDGKIGAATLHVLEFRGFERFLQGMQAELMPTITTEIEKQAKTYYAYAMASPVFRQKPTFLLRRWIAQQGAAR